MQESPPRGTVRRSSSGALLYTTEDGQEGGSFEAVDPVDDVRPDAQGEVIGPRCRVSDEVEQHRGAEERVVAKDGGEEPGERQG